jgi:hypothetical protein
VQVLAPEIAAAVSCCVPHDQVERSSRLVNERLYRICDEQAAVGVFGDSSVKKTMQAGFRFSSIAEKQEEQCGDSVSVSGPAMAGLTVAMDKLALEIEQRVAMQSLFGNMRGL